jgi:arylsulfatase A-like enzyme
MRGFLACSGLLAPLMLAVGVSAAGALLVLLPDSVLARLRAWLRPVEPVERRQRALALALAPAAALFWVLVVGRWALAVLGSELMPRAAGAALALAAVALGATLLAGVNALSAWAGPRFPRSAEPPVWLLASSLLCMGAFVAAASSGAPSGAGGPVSMLGVLSRDELDLRPVAFLGLLGLGAVLVPVPRSVVSFALALGCAAPPVGLWLLITSRGIDDRLSLALERQAPLSSKLLAAMRRLSDRDHDGYSAGFGGGDCDDTRPDVNPGAIDLPGNGVDEDCSGADAPGVPAPSPATTASVPADARAVALGALPDALNVVLLTVDTLRFDLGYAGTPRPISPKLDELAAESVVFDKAYSLASYTAKSLPPLLIGRYSSETHRGYSHFNRFEKSDTFLAQRLQGAGVHTISVQGHWYFFQNYGMERGYDVSNNDAAPRAAQAAEGDRSSTSDHLSDAVLTELEKPALNEHPFFLWAHYTDPHAEYVVHPGFEFGAGSRAAYDSEVAFVDHHVGRVLAALREKPYWSRTVVVVTSDHGEAFGEHAMIRHGFELWEELVRVPLIVRLPSVKPHHVELRRSAIDLVPTLLDLFRLPTPSDVSGTSLVLDLVQPPGYTPLPRPVFIDMAEGPNNAERRAFIENDQKLVVSGGRALGLFDLAQDPGEKKDLSADKARLYEAMDHFRAFRRGLHEITVRP